MFQFRVKWNRMFEYTQLTYIDTSAPYYTTWMCFSLQKQHLRQQPFKHYL